MTPNLVLSALVQGFMFPPGILLGGLVAAAFAGLLGRWRLAFLLIAAPAVVTLILSLPKIAYSFTMPLERRAQIDSRSALAVHALPRTAVVLGGGNGISGPDDRPDDPGHYLNAASKNRVVAAVRLWREGQLDRLLLSGGGGGTTSEAELMAQFAGHLGIPRTAIMLEPESRTTRENAQHVAKVLRENELGPDIALVTSAEHLPRAMVEFRCTGLAPVGVPAEFEALGVVRDFVTDWIPSPEGLHRSRRMLKEWLGALISGC